MFNLFQFLRKNEEAQPAAVEQPAAPEPRAPKTKADIICTAFDKEHAAGIKCTLTFTDDTTISAVVPRTDNLAKDQAAAAAMALQAANT